MTAASLPIPTCELVTKEGRDFDEENQLIEEALALLWAQFPHNTDTSQVLLKVLVPNWSEADFLSVQSV